MLLKGSKFLSFSLRFTFAYLKKIEPPKLDEDTENIGEYLHLPSLFVYYLVMTSFGRIRIGLYSKYFDLEKFVASFSYLNQELLF